MSNDTSLSLSAQTQVEEEEETKELLPSRNRKLFEPIKAQLARYQLSMYLWNNLFVVIGSYAFNLDLSYWLIFWIISTMVLIFARVSQLYSANIKKEPQIVLLSSPLSPLKVETHILHSQTSKQETEVQSNEEQSRLVWKEAFNEQMRIEGINSPVYIIQNSSYINSNNIHDKKTKSGLTKIEIKALGSSAFSQEQIAGLSEGNKTCSICLREYEPDKKIVYLKCRHCYHSYCIRLWLETHKKCPLCRQPVQ